MPTTSIRTLDCGQSGIISTIRAESELGRRIRDMGLVPGTVVTVYVRAPLRDPVALKVGGTIVTLRNSEADHTMW
jgi:ferrous iron transport protein A